MPSLQQLGVLRWCLLRPERAFRSERNTYNKANNAPALPARFAAQHAAKLFEIDQQAVIIARAAKEAGSSVAG